MAQEKVAAMSEFDLFMAGEISPALWSAEILLRLLDDRLPKDEFLQLARPLFSGLKTLESEVARQNLVLRVSLWAPRTHKPGIAKSVRPVPAPGSESFEQTDEFAFEVELEALRDSLSVAAPLFE
jgi:hypothetical protein